MKTAYGAWKNSKEDVDALDGYLKQFAPKADKPAEGNEKAASLVNAYNATAVRTILAAYPVESIHEVSKPFETKRWTTGGETIALNDIENGTLRPMLKYRAHSVLVCAARSCNAPLTAPTLLNRKTRPLMPAGSLVKT